MLPGTWFLGIGPPINEVKSCRIYSHILYLRIHNNLRTDTYIHTFIPFGSGHLYFFQSNPSFFLFFRKPGSLIHTMKEYRKNKGTNE